ncbi:unnamed protein product [Discula destructiva]
MASCWNRVYECEYQEYAIQYISECPRGLLHPTEIPLFPPPDSAPGSCSCNLGKLHLAVRDSENEGSACVTSIADAALAGLGDDDAVTTADKEEACACCGGSGAISAFYNICPNTQPSLIIGINEVYTYIADRNQPWESCAPYMNAYDCTAELNFTSLAGGTYYTPNDLPPPSGTASLSVIPGTVLVPPSGTLFSYTDYIDSTVYTITAVVDGKLAGFGGVTGLTTNAGVATDTGIGVRPTITFTSSATVVSGGGRDWQLTAVCVMVGSLAVLQSGLWVPLRKIRV